MRAFWLFVLLLGALRTAVPFRASANNREQDQSRMKDDHRHSLNHESLTDQPLILHVREGEDMDMIMVQVYRHQAEGNLIEYVLKRNEALAKILDQDGHLR